MNTIIMNKRNIQVLRGLETNKSLLSCSVDGSKVDLWMEDDGSGRQVWDIVQVKGQPQGIYNIIVSGGTIDGKKYLSCTADGSKVDLWMEDDNSGRQRWLIDELKSNIPSYFNIKVQGGVTGNRKYLSCTADGSKVDLWGEDDGSGRQRWQLQ
ncbi:MAG: hypothetical protein QM535_00150 [Limnohabitans sp.]|nr:hypothetical protein [Limnohabitans sp.]